MYKKPVAPREKGMRAVKNAHKGEDSAQFPCLGWASRRGCRLERQGGPCKYRHDPADKFRAQKESGEGGSGVHTRKPRLAFAMYRALPRRETETVAGKVEVLLNRPRVTKNRGTCSVSWRGELCRPNELGFQRMTRNLNGRDWHRFLNRAGSRAHIGV